MNKKQKYTARQIMLEAEYEVFHYKDKYLNQIQLHHHDFYEIYLFLAGDVDYLIEGKIYRLLPGDIVIINSNELHQPVFKDNSKPYERMVLWIDKEFVKVLSTSKTNLASCFMPEIIKEHNVARLPMEIVQSIKLIFIKLLNCKEQDRFGGDIDYKAYITDLLLIINKSYLQRDDIALQMKVDVKNNHLIQAVMRYIEEHIEEEIPLDYLASQFYVSKFYLSREFKKHTGTTIHRYIIQKKLITAKELILQNLPLIEIYKLIGFGDYCNFLRAFKNEYGITPKEFYKYMINK
ncbi:AraC family transcriptional regulator [Cellulosilyticum sp. I15G10I2]|uniref:AraC family transcriptional regulator n=1 Tax=Cellulosilyticum sp. I15G10I2 TaxID=1892843 RepID=UPI00085C8C07|nr:AraC family transcriptional regulator [Cellulosilyticum sp. I15G10I2]